MIEQWRPVPGFDMYAVSDQGRVRGPRRILKQTLIGNGYPSVAVCRDGKQHTARVHGLVLEAFVGPRPAGMLCRHLNGVPTDNRVENLRWGTPSENNFDRVRHGTHQNAHKTHCPQRHAYSEHGRVFNGKRYCKVCDRDRARAKYQKRKCHAEEADQ